MYNFSIYFSCHTILHKEKQEVSSKHGLELGKKFELKLLTTTNRRQMLSDIYYYFNNKIGKRVYEEQVKEMAEEVQDSKARPAVAWSSVLYKACDIRLTDEQKAELGNILGKYTVTPLDICYDFWHCLDWDAGDFYDSSSCYWGERSASRNIMMSDPDFVAIRFYDIENKDRGIARAIIYCADDFYVLFNVYSVTGSENISYLTASRVLSQHLHGNPVFHHTTNLSNCHSASGMLWINANGYLVPKDKSFFKSLPDGFDMQREDIDSAHYGSPTTCHGCGDECDDEWEYDGNYFCESCYYDYAYVDCELCGDSTYRDDTFSHDGMDLCPECYHNLPRCKFQLVRRAGNPLETMVRFSTNSMTQAFIYNSNMFERHLCKELVDDTECCEEHFARFGATCPNCGHQYLQIEERTTTTQVPAPGNRMRSILSYYNVYMPFMPCPNCEGSKNARLESAHFHA
jgi:hypothetical protein